MNRRKLLQTSAALGLVSAITSLEGFHLLAKAGAPKIKVDSDGPLPAPPSNPLVPPAHGAINVAFPISDGAVIIDFCGPWEVFQDAASLGGASGFQLYTVAETLKPITASGGMQIVPRYTFETAPAPKVIVIPVQQSNEAMLRWIRKSSKATDVTMSVCTGAFVLASTGLLSGKSATTFHQAYADFEAQFPDIHLKRGARFVEDGNLASAGGLSSGIDLAFRVIERYYGREAAERTAYNVEYQGKGWMNADSNEIYKKPLAASADGQPRCPVCGMDADRTISSVYKGKTYYFCVRPHKQLFDTTPEKFANQS
jgi:putative intracellular protease/amidase/YHS domain-containing protein